MPRIKYKGMATPPPGFDVRRCHIGIVGHSRVNAGDVIDVSDTQAEELLAETEHVFVLADEQKPRGRKRGRLVKS